MEYKQTLNLPTTDFPMRGRLPDREPEALAAWESSGLYERIQANRSGAPRFLLHDGPPYANGNIHVGHALNKVLKDIVLKYKTMAGFQTPYRPGWDCHGLPIELEVEKKVGRKKKAEMGVVEFRRRCRDYADRFVGVQRDDFRRLGILGEWDRPYLTKDFEFEAAEARELAAMMAAGSLYRDRKPVHWCASCRTALAEAEVDYGDHSSTSVFVAFAVPSAPAAFSEATDLPISVAIWTTTPWTLPANLAIALNGAFRYALVEAGERALVVAEDLVEGLREGLGLGKVLATVSGAELEGLETRHPWIDRASPVILGEHVTLEAGTGCVHTAPGHGHDDYVVGRRYGLDVYAPVDAGGRFTPEAGELEGQPVFAADSAVIEILEREGALLAQAPLNHSYPHCWRCAKPIIFRATEQWFVSMEHEKLRERALEQIRAVRWIPSWGRERIYSMVENRPDWCLSRQRSWGVPIIALHCKSCGVVEASEKLALHAAELFAVEGADAWFARDIADLLPEGTVCGGCGGTDFDRETDILDVWFDSGVSFSAVVQADFGEDVYADLYLEGSDQHRGWFHSALLASVATRGRAPYETVLTHGFVLDKDGRKMSKSLGNVTAPQAVIKQYGADILRLWVSAEDYRDDVKVSDEILKRVADSYRRVRNTSRNLLGNLADFDPAKDRVALEDMEELDRWILLRLHHFVERSKAAYEGYEFHVVYHALNNFCGVDLSSLYFDIVKDRLYCSGKDSVKRRSAQTAMYEILSALVRIIAPVLSFTADEIWKAMVHLPDAPDSVHLSDLPVADDAWADGDLAARWERLWEIRGIVTRALEDSRKAGDIGHSLDARVRLSLTDEDAALAEAVGPEGLEEIYIVSQVELLREGAKETTASITQPEGAKCGRCWKFSAGVGSAEDHPEICSSCHAVVA